MAVKRIEDLKSSREITNELRNRAEEVRLSYLTRKNKNERILSEVTDDIRSLLRKQDEIIVFMREISKAQKEVAVTTED